MSETLKGVMNEMMEALPLQNVYTYRTKWKYDLDYPEVRNVLVNFWFSR